MDREEIKVCGAEIECIKGAVKEKWNRLCKLWVEGRRSCYDVALSILWDFKEISGLGADFRAKWCLQKHGGGTLLFLFQPALSSNTLQGHPWKGYCQIWWKWSHRASLLSLAYFSRKCSQCSCYAWAVNADASPQCPVLSAHLYSFQMAPRVEGSQPHLRCSQLLCGGHIFKNCLVSAIPLDIWEQIFLTL